MAATVLPVPPMEGSLIEFARKIAREWFPKAQEQYLDRHTDRFFDGYSDDDLFRYVMDEMYWPQVDADLTPAECAALESAVWNALDQTVFAGAREFVEDAKADARAWAKGPHYYYGVSQRDFL